MDSFAIMFFLFPKYFNMFIMRNPVMTQAIYSAIFQPKCCTCF